MNLLSTSAALLTLKSSILDQRIHIDVVLNGRNSMRISETIMKSATIIAMVSAGSASLAATAVAAPRAQDSAQATIDELEADGYQVILNKVGNGPMDQCNVTAVRPGTAVKNSWIQRGPTGNVKNQVRYTTVYVDLSCKR